MTTGTHSPLTPIHIDDFADRVACLQNLYKDLISAHPCAHLFGQQLDIVGKAIAGLADQAQLAHLYGQSTETGRKQIMREAERIANMSSATKPT